MGSGGCSVTTAFNISVGPKQQIYLASVLSCLCVASHVTTCLVSTKRHGSAMLLPWRGDCVSLRPCPLSQAVSLPRHPPETQPNAVSPAASTPVSDERGYPRIAPYRGRLSTLLCDASPARWRSGRGY